MKAGTAQKIVLNLFSTAVMVRMGRVYRGLMVDMRARNAKLRRRAESHGQRNRPLSGRRRGAIPRTGRRRRKDSRLAGLRTRAAAKPLNCCSATAAICDPPSMNPPATMAEPQPEARWPARPPKSRRRPSDFLARTDVFGADRRARIEQAKPRIVVFCGRGSSGHVGVYLRYLFETRLGLLVSAAAPSVVTAYQRPPDMRDALFIVVSQSGRSPDLVTATQVARKFGALTLAIVNDESSPAAAASELVLPIGAGHGTSRSRRPKTVALSMIAGAQLVAALARDDDLSDGMRRLPQRLSGALACDWSAWADSAAGAAAAFVVGRGYGLGCVREIALKVCEILRVPTLGYSAAELRHGPRASITPATPGAGVATERPGGRRHRRPRPRPGRMPAKECSPLAARRGRYPGSVTVTRRATPFSCSSPPIAQSRWRHVGEASIPTIRPI